MDETSKEFKILKMESDLFKIQYRITTLEGEKQKELQNLREAVIKYNELKNEKDESQD